jgi:release factor glutamine methyltransferase
MTVKELLGQSRLKLTNAKIPSAILDAEVLLSHTLNQPKEFLYTYPESPINKKQQRQLKKLIKDRSKHIPIAYLTNRKEFYGLDFTINKNVLIPRPETEMIIDEIKNEKTTNETIADIGTGSGCIAITLKKLFPQTNIIATDISNKALKVAKRNAINHNVNIKLIHGNLLEKLKGEKLDIIVANLPYLPIDDKINREKISPEIKREPQLALWVNENGLKLYRKLFTQISELSHKPNKILCEIDPTQTKDITKLITKTLPKYQLAVKKDLAGRDRLVMLTK